ncbi:MAG: hypothetical protein U0529_06440 [Thermoanaerobaculia bacterium]
MATAAALGVATLLARRGRRGPGALVRAFRGLAARRSLAVAVVFAATLAGQLALLPLFGLPEPCVYDEFGYLLASETFASGRLTNPPHPFWPHFETFHVLQQPTYMAMHPPGPALVLAAARAAWGEPAVGVWIATAAACAAATWMLQAFVPPSWALAGGLLAAFRVGLFSYWSTTFWGGSVAAAAGALVLGAAMRFPWRTGPGGGLALGVGSAFLVLTRPFEGLLAAIPAWTAAAWRWWKCRSGERRRLLLRVGLPAALVLSAAAAFLLRYDAAVTGDPLTLPYQLQRATYAVGRHFVWQPPGPVPAYRHAELATFYAGWEMEGYQRSRRLVDLLRLWAGKAHVFWLFFAGPALTVPFALGLLNLRSRRRAIPRAALAVSAAGWLVVAWGFFPHYAGPVFGAILLVVVDGLRRLAIARVGGRRVARLAGVAVAVPLAVTACFRLAAAPLGLQVGAWPPAWYSTVRYAGYTRGALEEELRRAGGQHLVFVRYARGHSPHLEWVFNGADLAAARVLWARSMGEAADAALARHEAGRSVWLLEPDADPYRLVPYAPR